MPFGISLKSQFYEKSNLIPGCPGSLPPACPLTRRVMRFNMLYTRKSAIKASLWDLCDLLLGSPV